MPCCHLLWLHKEQEYILRKNAEGQNYCSDCQNLEVLSSMQKTVLKSEKQVFFMLAAWKIDYISIPLPIHKGQLENNTACALGCITTKCLYVKPLQQEMAKNYYGWTISYSSGPLLKPGKSYKDSKLTVQQSVLDTARDFAVCPIQTDVYHIINMRQSTEWQRRSDNDIQWLSSLGQCLSLAYFLLVINVLAATPKKYWVAEN